MIKNINKQLEELLKNEGIDHNEVIGVYIKGNSVFDEMILKELLKYGHNKLSLKCCDESIYYYVTDGEGIIDLCDINSKKGKMIECFYDMLEINTKTFMFLGQEYLVTDDIIEFMKEKTPLK